jgi:hypothetical protein
LKKEDVLLDEILAKGSLGGPVRDQILHRVLDRNAPTRRRRAVRVAGWLAIPCVAAFAGWIVFARPMGRREFAAKGVATPTLGAVDAGCSPSGPRVCRVGEMLVFTVNSAVASGYLGAYAERIGDPLRERIWYFPNRAGACPVVDRGAGTIAVRDGIMIGGEHPPGTYRITAWMSDGPIERSQIGPMGPRSYTNRSDMELKIVR